MRGIILWNRKQSTLRSNTLKFVKCMSYSPSFVLYLQKFYLKNTIQNITPFICYNSFHLETKPQAHDIYIKQTNHKLKVFYVGFFFLISLGFIETKHNCGAKGPGYPGPFRMVSPRAQPRRKTSEDD